MNRQLYAVISPIVGLSKYLISLWPIPAMLLLMQMIVSLIQNPVVTTLPASAVMITPFIFVVAFTAAAFWVHQPIRFALHEAEDEALEKAMSSLPHRALRGFSIAGLVCILYVFATVFISTILSDSIFTPRMMLSLGLGIIYQFGILLPTLAIALTTSWMARTRKKLSAQNLFIGNLEILQTAPWLIRSSNRPWLVFGVTSLIPVLILGLFTWLMFGTTLENEQHFIFMQAVTLVFSLMLGGIAMVFVTSKTMGRITKELTMGLSFLRHGKFSGHVAVMVDGDMGDLARGLNTALSGLKERENLKDSLAIASEIQRGLMPREEPLYQDYKISGFQQTSYSVGGDYYDHIQRSNGSTWLIIADVAGKGYPAALTVANLQAMLHALANAGNISLLDAASYINQSLHQTLQGGRFVTAFMAELNPEQHTLEWFNAGHIPPMLWQNNKIKRLEAMTPPLGMIEGLAIHTETLQLEPDDILFSCTDGITEARNSTDEMFGDKRLAAWYENNHGLSAEALTSSILSYLDEQGFHSREDDITILCLKRSNND